MADIMRAKSIFWFLIIMCWLAGCSSKLNVYSQITVSTPKGVQISPENIKTAVLQQLILDPQSARILELTIYEYSSGKEKLIYDIDGNISSSNEAAYMKVLCAITENGRLNKAFFVEASGSNDEQLITSLKTELMKQLR